MRRGENALGWGAESVDKRGSMMTEGGGGSVDCKVASEVQRDWRR